MVASCLLTASCTSHLSYHTLGSFFCPVLLASIVNSAALLVSLFDLIWVHYFLCVDVFLLQAVSNQWNSKKKKNTGATVHEKCITQL